MCVCESLHIKLYFPLNPPDIIPNFIYILIIIATYIFQSIFR